MRLWQEFWWSGARVSTDRPDALLQRDALTTAEGLVGAHHERHTPDSRPRLAGGQARPPWWLRYSCLLSPLRARYPAQRHRKRTVNDRTVRVVSTASFVVAASRVTTKELSRLRRVRFPGGECEGPAPHGRPTRGAGRAEVMTSRQHRSRFGLVRLG